MLNVNDVNLASDVNGIYYMSFLILISLLALLSAALGALFGRRPSRRDAMRYGMAGGFLFTGVDHFLNDAERYAPMLPPGLQPWALELVWFTGAAELAGAIGLLVPLAWAARMGWPSLRAWAGAGLAVLLVCVVVANVHVATSGGQVSGLPFGSTYYQLRPLLQPLFVIWALYVGGLLWRRPPAPMTVLGP